MITDICNLSFFSLSFCYQKVNPRVFVGVRSGDPIMNQKPSPLHRASEWIVDHYRLFFVVFAALLVFSAVASGWVKVENDVAAYLPADSETRQGLDIMEQEFQTYGSAKILLRDTDADAAAATAEQIHAVDGVDSCTYTMNDTGSALLSVSLSDLEGSDTCAQTVQALRDLLDGSGAYIYSAEGYSISDQINGEVRGLLVIVAIILVTVLTFTSSTYAEVPILLITFLAAALINKGTNFVFGTISFVSNAVAILLQLAMSVDYAIIFCNRYKQAHETLPVREAVIESLEKSITVISSSSLTTIAGLVAMTFMKFGLGRDLGIVLIKAILISMLTVFLLMPGLLLKLGPAMDKTKHRNFVPKISGVGRLAWRTRRVVPLVFAAVLVVACIGANRVSFVYSEAPLKTHNADANRTASQAITNDFGDETVLAVVVPAGDYTQEAALLDALSALPEVKSAVGIAGTEAAGGYRLADAVDYRTFAQLSDVDSTSAQALFALYAAENGATQTAAQNLSGYQVPLLKLFKFLNDKIADGTVTLSAAQAAQVTALSSGDCRIEASADGMTASCRMKVQVTIHEITLDQQEIYLLKEQAATPIQLRWSIAPADADDPTVRFTSNNEQVATVSPEGLVRMTGGYGTAVVTAASESGATASFTVNVVSQRRRRSRMSPQRRPSLRRRMIGWILARRWTSRTCMRAWNLTTASTLICTVAAGIPSAE